MATKKCPKCGEENPAEAVMCWACYTPLAGGAAAAAGGGLVAPRGGVAAVTPAATAAVQDEEKKKLDPKIFLVLGLLVGAIIIGGFTTGIFGGSSETTEITPTAEPAKPPVRPGGPTLAVRPPASSASPRVIAPDPPSPGGGPAASLPVKRYDVMVAPNPRYTVGTVGILATQPNITPAQAASLGRYAKNQFAPTGKWNRMQVLVFNDRTAAKNFLRYQAGRQNMSLAPEQYQEMAQNGLWSNVPAYLEFDGDNERPYQPSRNPNNWWGSQ